MLAAWFDESTELDALLDWADAIVVVTAHAAIDWPRVYGQADLVVDTVDSSRGRGDASPAGPTTGCRLVVSGLRGSRGRRRLEG